MTAGQVECAEWQTRIAPITDQGGTVAWWTDYNPDEVSDAGEVAAAVSLRNGDATDADVRYVAATFPEIYSLHLDGTDVTDEGLLCLHGMRSLTRVTLHDTHVTQRGVDELRAALPDCSIVCSNPLPSESSAPTAQRRRQ